MIRSLLRGVAVAVGVVAVGPLAWWVAQALPDEVPADQLDTADYVWDPPALTDTERLAIVLTSAALVLVAVLAMTMATRPRREWLTVAASMAGVTGYLGVTYAVATTPVIGANIGFGLLALGGLVAVPALLVVAVRSALRCSGRALRG